MKIAIHHRSEGFSSDWIQYCRKYSLPYKVVNCYSNTIVDDVADCEVLLWHFHQANCRDFLFAKQLIFSLQTAGKKVFPDFHTGWHFDDKVGQKYLLEAIGAPLVPSYVFYDRREALGWIEETEFPKVFKLRRGAGSSQVRLVENAKTARMLIKKAFGKGFSQYEAGSNLMERWRKYRMGHSSFWDVMKGVIRFGYTTDFDRVVGNEKGYAYFQDFIPENESDTRVIVIDGKAFAIKRIVRKNDFRASGSGEIRYSRQLFDEDTIKIAFELAEKLKSQSLALDFVYENGKPMIVELSYGYTAEVYEPCVGYWDRQMNFHEGKFNPQYWMVESFVKKAKSQSQVQR